MPPAPGPRSSSSTPRATSSPRCRARGTAPVSPRSSPSSSRSTGPRARSSPATTPTSRRRPPTPRCASPARRSPCRTARSSSATRPTTRSCTSRTTCVTERARWGGEGQLNEPQGVAASRPPTWPSGSGSTCSSPTRSTTRSRESASPTARSTSWPAPGRSCASARAAVPALEQALSTPWDLAWLGDRLVIAMAGTHQLWAWTPGEHPRRTGASRSSAARPTRVSSTGRRREAWFAQPSGLATSASGDRVWVADSETSALRSLTTTADGGPRRRDARRHRPLRLRPPRRRRRRGAAPAPPGRHRAARRLGRGQRHLQRRGPPLRPGDGPGHDPRAGPRRAERRRRRARPRRRARCASSSSSRQPTA